MTNLEILLSYLGYQGGTIHQVASELTLLKISKFPFTSYDLCGLEDEDVHILGQLARHSKYSQKEII